MGPRRQYRDRTFARLRGEFLGYENVIGVSVGTKFSNGVRQKGVQSVQFFVSKKVPESKLARVLPRVLELGLEVTDALPTDVIELRNLEVCCWAGRKLDFSGGSGTATILFENTNSGDARRLFLTCAHVTGAVDSSPLPATTILGAHEDCFFRGRFLHRAIHANQRLEFDVALGELTTVDPRFVNLQVGPAGK